MEKVKRIIALTAVVLIVISLIATVVSALFINHFSVKFFIISMSIAVTLPIVIYLGMWIYGVFNKNDMKREYREKEENAFAEAKKYGK